MAHIPDGVLSLPVLAFGAGVTLVGCAWGLRRLDTERIPQTALLSAVFFVAALAHFPVGPTSVHLILNGLVGVMLGAAAFPAILIALLLQAMLFGFGGLATLGVNVMNMAVPAVLAGALFRWGSARWGAADRRVVGLAGAVGAAGVALTAGGMAAALALSGGAFWPAAQLALYAHLPVMVIEGFFTAAAVGFMLRVKPGFFAMANGEAMG